MRIRKLRIQNFRGLRSIEVPELLDINVVVGPNAVGKSTLLEAIRLVKVMLAPRMINEGQHALVQMGALNLHNQAIGAAGMDFSALTNTQTIPIEISATIELTKEEISYVRNDVSNLSLLVLQAEMSISGAESPLAFTQFLSTDVGKKQLRTRAEQASNRLADIEKSLRVHLDLIIDPTKNTISGGDALQNAVIALLDRRLPIHKSLFSMFPADRAFPQGEQPIQVGAGDAGQLLQSHMATPAMKYARLKQTIIHNILLVNDGRERLVSEFNLIFNYLLPGKRLAGIEINALGLLKILVEDLEQKKRFDIDQMSSGEKGLVLTFLFMRLSMESGGIVLLDEPELHLNASVQAKLLPFLDEHCSKDLNTQLIICTHSPEIVKESYHSDKCRLFHLRSGDDLTPILRQDQRELFEVFERLGSSTADVLFTRGNIYVEGEHDNSILQAGFGKALSGCKITPLGGRAEIEREIPNLQSEERSGKLKKIQLFILDNDRKPTKLNSTKLVKVHQHKRYCLENYLIDFDIMFDLISAHASNAVCSRGAFPSELQEMAFSQIRDLVVQIVYGELNLPSHSFKIDSIKNSNIDEIADSLKQNLVSAKEYLDDFEPDQWRSQFIRKCEERTTEIQKEWSSSWKEKCSGKRLIDDIYIKYKINMNKPEFKREIIRRMAQTMTDEWRTLNDLLVSELN